MPTRSPSPPQPGFWARMIALQARSGLTQREFCAAHDLSLHRFRDWKYVRIPRRAAPPTRPTASRISPPSPFLPVRLLEMPPVRPGVLELVLAGGRLMRVPADFDPAALRRFIDVLDARPC